jgi:putative endonuclease
LEGFFILHHMKYFVYVLYSDSHQVKYTGFTEDIERRLYEHNNGLLGKFTKGKGPWRIIYLEEFGSKTQALVREKYFKTGVGRAFIKMKTGIKGSRVPVRRGGRFLEIPLKKITIPLLALA